MGTEPRVFEHGRAKGHTKLALNVLIARRSRSGGRLGARRERQQTTSRLGCTSRCASMARFEVRSALPGPFVIRSRKPTRTIREFLLQTQVVSLSNGRRLPRLDINLLTVERALGLRGLDAAGAR